MRTLEEIRAVIERYPSSWRHWCTGPDTGGCACLGCVRNPPPCDYPGQDPECRPFRRPEHRLTRQEVELYQDWLRDQGTIA